MYKPVPFFMSSQGYGMFVHTSAPLTLDLGGSYGEATVIYLGDDELDLFFFFGSPKEILSEYTALTGRAPTPPLWTFGLWMGRETYSSEDEVREVAKKLREHVSLRRHPPRHRLDGGAPPLRLRVLPFAFPDPRAMLSDLKRRRLPHKPVAAPLLQPEQRAARRGHREGLRGPERIRQTASRRRGLRPQQPRRRPLVPGEAGPSSEDGRRHLHRGLRRGGPPPVSTTRGEAASSNTTSTPALQQGGRRGRRRDHRQRRHLRPQRLGRQPALPAPLGRRRGDLRRRDGRDPARRPLSGPVRFLVLEPLYRGVLLPNPRDLYRRWLAFGALCSHARCHGAPPTEPWEYGEEFTDEFRRIVELRYRLMPYVYAQARLASREGHPMVRALFFEYPEDPTSWLIEDQYLFGTDLLVAPLMEDGPVRNVYLPPGLWTDYQTGETYAGERWHSIRAGEIPAVLLVRSGAAIPHARLARAPTRWTGAR